MLKWEKCSSAPGREPYLRLGGEDKANHGGSIALGVI
jgi:hypothetical protein